MVEASTGSEVWYTYIRNNNFQADVLAIGPALKILTESDVRNQNINTVTDIQAAWNLGSSRNKL